MTAAERRVLELAKRIADDAPAKQGKYVHRAGVRWALIHELRAALDAYKEES